MSSRPEAETPTGGVYEYHDGLTILERYSNRRAVTAAAMVTAWNEQAVYRAPRRILDVGTGDGVLLRQCLEHLQDSAPGPVTIHLIEPDPRFQIRSQDELRDLYPAAELAIINEPTGSYDWVSAAHVVYYIPDVPSWMGGIRMVLSQASLFFLVLRGTSCDTYKIRNLVLGKGRPGSVNRKVRRRLADDTLVANATSSGLSCHVQHTDASWFRKDLTNPEDPMQDEEIDLLVRWMGRIPIHAPIPTAVRAAITSFLVERTANGCLNLRLEDTLLIMRPRV